MTCRIAQVQGVDLCGHVRAKSGATIATVIDYLEPYLSEPKKWGKEQIADFPNDGLYFLAFAGMGLKKPEYVALYRKLEHAGRRLAQPDRSDGGPLGECRPPDAALRFISDPPQPRPTCPVR